MTEFQTKLLAVLEEIAQNTMNINSSLCEHWEIDYTYQKPVPFETAEPKSYDQMIQTMLEKTEDVLKRYEEDRAKKEFRKANK